MTDFGVLFNIEDICKNFQEEDFAGMSDQDILEYEDSFYEKLNFFRALNEETNNENNFITYIVRLYSELFSLVDQEKRKRNIYSSADIEDEIFEYDDSHKDSDNIVCR